ncbi:hypothetical protein ACT80S_13915 [Ramlibacter sp. MAHUQ-53]|uniref:hypothetical protein n=1 Tax=unclassified Ramlibacter TaxID=2617605 RepID=UPI00363683BB
MSSAEYRIESNRPLSGRLLPQVGGRQLLVGNRGLAVALAAKNFRAESGQEIRVVHVPTGEIVYRKREGRPEAAADEA